MSEKVYLEFGYDAYWLSVEAVSLLMEVINSRYIDTYWSTASVIDELEGEGLIEKDPDREHVYLATNDVKRAFPSYFPVEENEPDEKPEDQLQTQIDELLRRIEKLEEQAIPNPIIPYSPQPITIPDKYPTYPYKPWTRPNDVLWCSTIGSSSGTARITHEEYVYKEEDE